MSRPSRNLDKKLIELGKKRIVSEGIANLSIRQICLSADINLGMFYYYFKSKENFIKALFKSMNDDLAADFVAGSEKLATSRQKLKKVLFITAEMMRERRGIIETMIKDVNIFDELYTEIRREIYAKWLKFYGDLVNECKKDGYLDKDADTDILISALSGALHSYARCCEFYRHGQDEYYKRVEKMIDFIMEKFK